MGFETKNEDIDKSLKCSGCGAILHFEPGSDSLVCQYCGTRNEIAREADLTITAVAYDSFISGRAAQQREEVIVQCGNCGATTTMLPGVTADSCPFCASPLVVNLQSAQQILKPHYVLPFLIGEQASLEHFRKWLDGLWFAPGDLLKKVREQSAHAQQLKGVYIPYWSYDTDTETTYSGQRGEYYYVTESYTDSDGKRHTRQVRHTRWYPAAGTVYCQFRDVLVSASDSLPQKMADILEPWELERMQRFNEQYLSGFRSETYKKDAPEALGIAKQKMDPEIRNRICSHIGGDTQLIDRYQTKYHKLGLKYLLLPVWISAYRYDGKLYRFVVNASTGEVTGDRPWSWIKITIAVLLGLVLLGLLWYAVSAGN